MGHTPPVTIYNIIFVSKHARQHAPPKLLTHTRHSIIPLLHHHNHHHRGRLTRVVVSKFKRSMRRRPSRSILPRARWTLARSVVPCDCIEVDNDLKCTRCIARPDPHTRTTEQCLNDAPRAHGPRVYRD